MRLVRALCVAALAVLPAVGCGEDVPDPQVNGVFPSNGFIGRNLRVEVSGDISEWSNSATVSFGDGIVVNSVSVSSPSALFAEITIDDSAAEGLRDVTVTDGGETLTLSQSFSVESSLDLQVDGNAAQGSVAFFTIKNRDPFAPFDATSTGDGFFTPIEFTNLSVTAGPGVTISINSVDAFNVSGNMLFDIDATSGQLLVTSGPPGDLTVSALAGEFTVDARTATPITSGTPATGNVANPFDSQLYEFSATGPAAVEMLAATRDANASASFFLLPASGRFAEALSFDAVASSLLETGSQRFFMVYFDQTGSSGYSYTLDANQIALVTQAEVEPNNLPAAAKTATFASLVTTSTLADATDEDWYKITVAAGDIGKSVRVVTGGANPFTDTVVEVFSDAIGNNSLGVSDDSDFHENFTSDPIPANTTTITVKVSASEFFDPAESDYIVAIYLQ